ncbi:MAG: ABC transporter ATP-binding protein [Acidobacteriota bacterium]
MKILRAYLYLFTHHRRAYLLGGAFLLATNGIALAIPRVLGWAIDALAQGTTNSALLGYGAVIIALAVAQTVPRIGSRVYVLSVSRRVAYRLKGMLHDRLLQLAPSFFGIVNTGDLMSRMTNDVMLVRALGGPGVLYSFNALVVYVMGMAYMLSISWRLTLIVFLPLPIIAWLVRGLVHRVKAYASAARVALADINTMVQENLAGVQVVKAFALEDAQMARFDGLSRAYMGWGLKEAWTRAQMIPLVGMSGGVASVAVLGVGAGMVASGSLSLGDLVAFFSYISIMVFPTVALGWILSLIQRGAAALERLDEVLTAPITIASPQPPPPSHSSRGDVQIQNLRFRYDDAPERYGSLLKGKLGSRGRGNGRRPALQGVDLEAKPGGFVALVGKVGSGKSTLLKAILRLLEVPEGSVFVDGHDVTAMDLAGLRGHIGYVPQDDFLFSTSVKANIAYGRPGASDEEVLASAEAAGLTADLQAIPDGLDARVGERGLTLSGGQRQRVALARALLLDPPLLLLDNALSNVDADTERQILDNLRGTRNGTLLVASNRIGAVQDADRIYVLDEGRVIDAGTHDQLIRRPGLYANMFEQQRLSAELEEF